MSDKIIVSVELEKLVLASLLQYKNDIYNEVCQYLSEGDFVALGAHAYIFTVCRNLLEQNRDINPIIITQELKNSSVYFKEISDVYSYLEEGLGLLQVTLKGGIDAVKELKKITIARELVQSAKKEQDIVHKNLDKPVQEIIDMVDEQHNSHVNCLYIDNPVKEIFGNLEETVEERGNNPIEHFGFMSPFPKLNDLYGSIVRPGNIAVFTARAGAAKSTLLLNFGINYGIQYGIPIISLDNGELNFQEQQWRAAACLSGVPIGLIESGKWRLNPETMESVRKIWPLVKKLKYHYIQVGGKSTKEMIGLARRTYYNKVGRNNPTVLIFDYFKSYNDISNRKEYEIMGQIVQEFKDFITGEIPMGMIAACQSNRSGITTNRNESQLIQDESIVGASDRITFYSSHLFLLRRKTLDTIASENNKFGNYILMNLKSRHLGHNVDDAIHPVKMPDGNFKTNYLHLDIKNFSVKELGDLKSTAPLLGQLNIQNNNHHHAEITL